MKYTALNIMLVALLASLSLASFAETQLEEALDCEEVENMVRAGSTPSDIVDHLYHSGMALSGATVLAMECGGQENRVATAEAGVGLAGNLVQANSVVRAVAEAAGETGPETVAARRAYGNAERLAKQPDGYRGDYTPQGGTGVSPST